MVSEEKAVQRALLVMAKQPEAGRTKTRLTPHLSEREAADLYRCLLSDTLELMRQVPSVQPIIAYHPEQAQAFFRDFAPPDFDFVPQVGADLGARLDNVLTHCLKNGYRQAAVMNSDGPTLPLAYLEQAFGALDDPAVDVVLGPSDDGGYYLIGLKGPCPALFRGIVMSTATVLAETLALAKQEGLRTVCLPSWYDVDTYEDLARLTKDLSSLPRSRAPHTRAFLARTGRL
jgi:rSAM/selenodomain-associated transferase 1